MSLGNTWQNAVWTKLKCIVSSETQKKRQNEIRSTRRLRKTKAVEPDEPYIPAVYSVTLSEGLTLSVLQFFICKMGTLIAFSSGTGDD